MASKEWESKYNPFNSDKALVHLDRFKRVKKGEPLPPPVTLSVDLASICNLKCSFCNAHKVMQDNHSSLSKETIDHLNRFLGLWGVEQYGGVRGVCCFTGDMKVKLLDGTEKTFEELFKKWKKRPAPFEVYSRNNDGEIVPGVVSAVIKTREVNELVKLMLDNGEEIICTPDHKFLLRDSSSKEAKELGFSDSLMPLHTYIDKNATKLIRLNHRVIAKTFLYLKNPLPVYCLTVEKFHNFALSSGVFVMNCGGHGESTLNPHLDYMIKGLYEHGIKAGLVTNGVRMDHERLTDLEWVGVSVDAGTSETYKKIKGADKFEQVIINMKGLVDASKGTHLGRPGCASGVFYKFLLSPENVQDIHAASKIAKEIGCKGIQIRPVGDPWDRSLGLEFTPGHLALFYSQLDFARKTLEDDVFKIYGLTHKFDGNLQKKNDFEKCYGIMIGGAISPSSKPGYNFSYSACCDLRGKPGYTKDFKTFDEFQKFWGSDAHWKMAESINPAKCPRCTLGPINRLFEQVVNVDNLSEDLI